MRTRPRQVSSVAFEVWRKRYGGVLKLRRVTTSVNGSCQGKRCLTEHGVTYTRVVCNRVYPGYPSGSPVLVCSKSDVPVTIVCAPQAIGGSQLAFQLCLGSISTSGTHDESTRSAHKEAQHASFRGW